MSRRKRLWGTTRLGSSEIKIYRNPHLANYNGLTYSTKRGIYIDIASQVFDDPALFDTILIHEFIHALEYHYVEALDFKERSGCSPGVRLLSIGLAQMLRELRQVGIN